METARKAGGDVDLTWETSLFLQLKSYSYDAYEWH